MSDQPFESTIDPTSQNAATAVVAAPSGRAPVATEPCFCCGSTCGVPVGFVDWWGPAGLFQQVKCVDCPNYFNARTGESNAGWVLAFLVVYFLVGLGVGGLLAA